MPKINRTVKSNTYPKFFYCYAISLSRACRQSLIQTNAHRAQMNIISTMIIVSVAFAICWFPSQLWYLFYVIQYNIQNNDTFYSFSLFLILNICFNPFINATQKLGPMKKKLRDWVSKSGPTPIWWHACGNREAYLTHHQDDCEQCKQKSTVLERLQQGAL